MGYSDYVSKRKQDEIPPEKRRTNAVKVMLNEEEFSLIESLSSSRKISKAEIIRALVFNQKIDPVKVVPEVNLELARNLGRALGNLATVAGVMRSGKFVELEDVKYQVLVLQKALRGDDD